ncbi:MAG TPA: hypothetical protein VG166_06440, partial [Caulobacteraceae bacterium]|nr:hypothetical protein [Caulobacteraceae bacterium]
MVEELASSTPMGVGLRSPAPDGRASPAWLSRWALSNRQTFALLALTLILFGGFVQALLILNGDLAWLLTLDEKWLAGQRPYADLLEVNPPMSLLIYMPAVWISRIVNVQPQYIILAQVFALICASTYLTSKILHDILGSEKFRLRFAAVTLFLFILFPWDVFGQRDHIAVIALFPFVALAIAHGRGLPPAKWLLILAGLGAGLAMCIKPHFALVVGMPMLLNAVRTRSIRPLFGLETWIASAVVIAYAAIVVALFPAYLGPYLDRVVTAYLRAPRRFTLIAASVLLAVTGSALVCLRLFNDRRALEWAAPWFAASLGGLGLFLAIGKWWSYSGYAMLVMAVAPILTSMTAGGDARPSSLKWTGRFLATATALCCMNWLAVGPQYAFLIKPVASVAPPHPKIITITYQITVGHPLVRELHGEWVGTSSAQIMAA